MDADALPGQTFTPPPTISAGQSLEAAAVPPAGIAKDSTDHIKLVQLIHAYQARGHNICDLDPLGMYDADLDGSVPPDLDLANYGFTESDMEKEFVLDSMVAQGGFLGSNMSQVGI